MRKNYHRPCFHVVGIIALLLRGSVGISQDFGFGSQW
jgi:hypothetical protein